MKDNNVKMTCYLTKNGWEMTAENADSDKVWQSSLNLQHSYLEVLGALDAMKPRSQATAYFKLVLRFKPAKKGTRITLDYKMADVCPTKYRECGMDLYNVLLEELQK